VYRFLVRKPDGQRPSGKPRYRWEDNIKMDLQELECGGMDWIELDQGTDTCECGNETSGSMKYWEFFD